MPTAGYRFIAQVTVLEENPVLEPMRPVATTRPTAEFGKGGGAKRFGAKGLWGKRWVFASVILLLAAVGVAAYFLGGHPRRVLTDKDTLVLADFDNSTGDPVFDGTLRQGLAVQLEQSPFLNLVTEERIQQVLKLMGQPADTRLTPAIAREICERTAARPSWTARSQRSAASTYWGCAQRTAATDGSSRRSRRRQRGKKMY